jgi:hypothetical protein
MESVTVVQQQMDRAITLGEIALASHDLLQIERLDQKLRTLDAVCRELFQETLSDAYLSIAAKLEQGKSIDANERKALEILFTGEAEHYLKTENNYQDWITELNRLIAEIRRTRDGGLESLADLMHVQALCRDAMHVFPEVIYFLREKERVALFRESLQGEFTPESGRMLARMIRDMMSSPHR